MSSVFGPLAYALGHATSGSGRATVTRAVSFRADSTVGELVDWRVHLGRAKDKKFREEKRVQVGVEMDEYPEEEYKPARDSL